MKRKKVTSTNINSVGYSNKLLEDEFKNNRIYLYLNVPEIIYYKLMQSSSKGSFLYEFIRNKYLFKRIK